MGQVPSAKLSISSCADPAVLLIGNGRLANALAQVASPQPVRWWRTHPSDRSFSSFLKSHSEITHVWLAISDRSIVDFATEHRALLQDLTVVHFSGAMGDLHFPFQIFATHPLMTFASSSFDPLTTVQFEEISFVLSHRSPTLQELLPGFKNSIVRIDDQDRPYYHALCAMAGSFTVLIWEEFQQRLIQEIGVPVEALAPYRRQIFANLNSSLSQPGPAATALTGPLARQDWETVNLHVSELMRRSLPALAKIYDSFIDLYRTKLEML